MENQAINYELISFISLIALSMFIHSCADDNKKT